MHDLHPVTDHAVLRYMERVLDIDVSAVRNLIHAETETALTAGAAGLCRDDVRYVFANGKVVTVISGGAHG